MVSYQLMQARLLLLKLVLILIVVDNGLVLSVKIKSVAMFTSLNPYCSGQWSRT